MKILPILILSFSLLVLDCKNTKRSEENIELNGVRIIEDKDLLDSINLEELTKNARKVKPVKLSSKEKKTKKDL